MKTELITLEPGKELGCLTTGLSELIKNIKEAVDYSDTNLDTKKGRDQVISAAFKVTKTKTAIAAEVDRLIDSKNKEIAPTLKTIELLKQSKKTTDLELSDLAKEVRKQVTDWEELESERVRVEQEKLKEENLAEEKDRDHEIANFMHDNFCREQLEAIETERIEREAIAAKAKSDQEARDKKIADEAAEKAKSNAEAEKAQAIQDKLDAEEREKQAEINRLASEETARQQQVQAVKDAEAAKVQAKKNADAAAEQARLAEVKRQDKQKADAEAERLRVEANTRHVGSVRREIREILMVSCKIDEPTAKKVVLSLLKIERITIKY